MDIIMPKMGESVSEGTIIKWHKKVGQQVKRDEIIFEISTDKVDTEIPSPVDGVLQEIKANEGDTVEVGSVVAVVSENGSAPVKKETTAEKEPVKEKETQKEKEPEVKQTSVPSGNVIDIALPKMGESVMEGTIIKWHKKVGEKVKKDETIFEISTDKVDTEIPSPEDGTLSEILVAEQETVEVGTIVARLSTSEGGVVRKTETKPVEEAKTQQVKVEENKEIAKPTAMHDSFSSSVARDENKGGAAGFYSPLVLNIARKENVPLDELRKINGSGLEGRVTKKDILSYIETRKKQPVKKEVVGETKKTISYQPTYSNDEIEEIPMDNIRQKIMQHMVNSRDTSVHVSSMLEVDMTRIHNFIQVHKDEYLKNEGIKLTYMAFVANASVKALKEFPLVNSIIEGNRIIRKKFINLGIAVAIEPSGLIVPNIKSAGQKNLVGLAHDINDLAMKSRNKKLTPDDITGGTFTITNYGVFGTIFGTPIINQPEVAILGVGSVVKKPVVIEVDETDTIAVRHIMALTLSFDHRLIDGMLGGKFLKYLKDTLENFDLESI